MNLILNLLKLWLGIGSNLREMCINAHSSRFTKLACFHLTGYWCHCWPCQEPRCKGRKWHHTYWLLIMDVKAPIAPLTPGVDFAETVLGVHPLIFAETGYLTVCGRLGAAAFLLKKCLRATPENSWICPGHHVPMNFHPNMGANCTHPELKFEPRKHMVPLKPSHSMIASMTTIQLWQ